MMSNHVHDQHAGSPTPKWNLSATTTSASTFPTNSHLPSVGVIDHGETTSKASTAQSKSGRVRDTKSRITGSSNLKWEVATVPEDHNTKLDVPWSDPAVWTRDQKTLVKAWPEMGLGHNAVCKPTQYHDHWVLMIDGVYTISDIGEQGDTLTVSTTRKWSRSARKVAPDQTIGTSGSDDAKPTPEEYPADIQSLNLPGRELVVWCSRDLLRRMWEGIHEGVGYASLGIYQVQTILYLGTTQESEKTNATGQLHFQFVLHRVSKGDNIRENMACLGGRSVPDAARVDPDGMDVDDGATTRACSISSDTVRKQVLPTYLLPLSFNKRPQSLGWYCSWCGKLNVQVSFLHRRCSCSIPPKDILRMLNTSQTSREFHLPPWTLGEAQGAGYDSSMQYSVPDVSKGLRMIPPLHWKDGMITIAFCPTDKKNESAITYVSTSKNPILQAPATRLLEEVQTLEIPICGPDVPSGEADWHCFRYGWPPSGSAAGEEMPPPIQRVRHLLRRYTDGYAQAFDFALAEVWIEAWVSRANGKPPIPTTFAPKSATVVLCLGGDVDVSIDFQDVGPTGSDLLMEVDTQTGRCPHDDMTESANESVSTARRTRPKAKRSKKNRDADCMNVQLKMVHGDGVYFKDEGMKALFQFKGSMSLRDYLWNGATRSLNLRAMEKLIIFWMNMEQRLYY